MSNSKNIESFEILMREHQSMLYSYLIGLVRNPELAEEITQITFIKAYRRLSTLNKKNSFPAWLRTIGRNTAFDELKKLKREIATDPEIFSGMEDIFMRFDDSRQAENWSDRVALVKNCFEKLPETLMAICKLYYMDDLKAKDVANSLSITLGTALKRLERSRNLLRHCVSLKIL